MRMTNSSYPVAWLIAEEEAEDYYGLGEEDYSEEDNSAWNECDNYILRSSVSLTTGPLLLVEIVETLCSDWRDHRVATPALLCHKAPYLEFFLPFAGTLWHKDRWLACRERISYRRWHQQCNGSICNLFFLCLSQYHSVFMLISDHSCAPLCFLMTHSHPHTLLSMQRPRYPPSSLIVTRQKRTRTSSLRTPTRTTGRNKFRSSET